MFGCCFRLHHGPDQLAAKKGRKLSPVTFTLHTHSHTHIYELNFFDFHAVGSFRLFYLFFGCILWPEYKNAINFVIFSMQIVLSAFGENRGAGRCGWGEGGTTKGSWVLRFIFIHQISSWGTASVKCNSRLHSWVASPSSLEKNLFVFLFLFLMIFGIFFFAFYPLFLVLLWNRLWQEFDQ